MPLCPECHHQPSGRIADYGAACWCKCHDVADASPELLAALELWIAYAEENLHEFDLEECQQETLCPRCENSGCINLKIRTARAALAKARGEPSADTPAAQPAKYSADWIRQQVRDKKAITLLHHECGICGEWVGFHIVGDSVEFDPNCGCPMQGSSRPSSFEDIAEWLRLQKNDAIRDEIMSRLY